MTARMEDIENQSSDDDVINSLPDEILERILSYLSTYGECKEVSLVCKRWYRVIQGILLQRAQNFQIAAEEGRLRWSYHECPATPLTGRHSHNMCRIGTGIYVFGGCSSSLTSFNDMWKLDLITKSWSRVLALGTYPSPKAAATMVAYSNCLILFGGWAPPVPYPLHQAPHIFNELQIYKIKENRWNVAMTRTGPPPLAGHQATIVGHKMVVFGGMVDAFLRVNDVYELDLTNMTWRQVRMSNPIPSQRYGHFQCLVDKQHLLVLGGCGISNKTLSDVWLLEMGNNKWKWKRVEVRNQEHAPAVIFGHPACKIGSSIVIFSKSKNPNKPVTMHRSQVLASAPRPAPPERTSHVQRVPVNVRRELRNHGVLLNGNNRRLSSDEEPGAANMDGANEPSTSGQSSRGQSSSDSQVCDEIHTNSSSSTNTVAATGALGAVAMDTNNSDGAPTNIQSSSLKLLPRPTAHQGAGVHNKCNKAEKDSKLFQKSNLNQAHMGQLPTRINFGKRKKLTDANSSSSNSRTCMCKKQQMRPTIVKHMQQFVLDISCVVSEGYVTWQPIVEQDSDHVTSYGPIRAGLSNQHGPPPETSFSSICEGRGELIMFGGLLEDSNQFGSPSGKCAVNTIYHAT